MILAFQGKIPKIDPSVFIAESAIVIGDVEIGPGSNVWFHTIVRGDVNAIRIGRNCNIQDACVLHVVEQHHPLFLEDGVVLGHRVVVHGCRIKRGSMVGMGAIVLNGAEVGEESIVGAGSVVTPGTIIPPRTLALGSPAKAVRPLKEIEVEMIQQTVRNYQQLQEVYQGREGRGHPESV